MRVINTAKICRPLALYMAILVAAAAAYTGCVTSRVATDPKTGNTVTNYVPSPAFEATVAAARAVAPAVPGPYGELAAGLLTALTAAVSTYAYQKTKHNARLAQEVQEHRELAKALAKLNAKE